MGQIGSVLAFKGSFFFIDICVETTLTLFTNILSYWKIRFKKMIEGTETLGTDHFLGGVENTHNIPKNSAIAYYLLSDIWRYFRLLFFTKNLVKTTHGPV